MTSLLAHKCDGERACATGERKHRGALRVGPESSWALGTLPVGSLNMLLAPSSRSGRPWRRRTRASTSRKGVREKNACLVKLNIFAEAHDETTKAFNTRQ